MSSGISELGIGVIHDGTSLTSIGTLGGILIKLNFLRSDEANDRCVWTFSLEINFDSGLDKLEREGNVGLISISVGIFLERLNLVFWEKL